MIYCRMDLDKVSPDGKTILLYCAGVGIFPVFTGLAPYTNKAGCASRENGPIPTGKYWIIDRPRGGICTRVRNEFQSLWTGNNYDEWFALYRQDGVLDDGTWLYYTHRGNFRLHPLRPDGSGYSDGCITFFNQHDFQTLRHALLAAHIEPVPDSNLRAYGEVTVLGDMNALCV